ncbi:glycoside hydrolase family 16 protein [Cellvibrio sp.]
MNINNNVGLKAKLAAAMGTLLFAAAPVMADVLNPTIGSLLYEENFNTLDSSVWNSIEGDGCAIGLCGWGNQELQYYRANNLTIENVPFEPATKALAIQAKRETFGGSAFTSGKITTENKLQIKYGMIEIRMSTPQVGLGLWPAAWMLGTSLATWPAKGEIDIMEMGHRAQAMADAGFPGADINSYVGSNAIFYANAACVPANPTCAASTAWQTDNAYVAHTPLTNRFVKYRLYWTDSQIRFTVIDNGVETDMYQNPIPVNEESSEFQAPFYLLFNLAVGGNFTDAANAGQVTAPLPGKMYVDYVRVYQLDGKGEVKLGSQVKPETGTFGVFTDNTATTNKQVAGASSDIWIWNTTSTTAGTTAAYEGTNVIAWKYTAPQWFGGGIASRQARDMSRFVNGNMKFRIKIPANVAFKIGVQDTYTNQNWLTFPANTTTYGLVRNGDWAQATVPVSALRGSLVALQSMSTLFSIASVDGALPTSNFEMAIDDVIWECGTSTDCQAAVSSSSAPSSVAPSSRSSTPSSVAPSSRSSTPSSVAPSSRSSSSVAPSSSSVAANTNGHTVLSSTSVKFFVNNAAWADIHYTINNGPQQNIRLTHNADNSNTLTVAGIPAGALVKYSYTIGQAVGAIDTAWAQFNLPMASSSASSVKSSVASSVKSSVTSTVKSSVASSIRSSVASSAATYGYTKLSATSVRFYANNSPWTDIHYTVNGGAQQNIRMTHNADNTNVYTLSGVPAGAVIRYFYTIGQAVGAVDTAWVQFNL